MTDHDALAALNDDYIRSVQQGDVARFRDILAEDFRCSNPDGTLLDKADFLEQAGRPVAILPSSMPGPAIARPRARHGRAATPMSGRGARGAGSRSRRM
jgi:hypothetical protein